MKWKFEFLPKENYIRVTSEGVYNPTDHRQMMIELLSLPEWHPGMAVLLDNRKLSYAEAVQADLQQSSDDVLQYNSLIGESKIAFLVGSLGDVEAIRRFELMTEEDVSAWMQVFLDENQALRWLLAYRSPPVLTETQEARK
jgi:hypothetical protein